MKKAILFLLFLTTTNSIFAQLYVDKDATGSNNGSSWANAYTDLQAAINNASAGQQIFVKKVLTTLAPAL
ncbi:hypothetical protein [Niabella ginsengisoli]|uniref:Uncharacterized protein n=1 Tax=Niabella ginsengisoli TaxID=522298 RepID=A0ABS9SFC1_9BACT|nr:hypothetical protein [Niabella ginsengisoli]MCH5597063.1 hypothetical protein [Niabella ginsengisoli]